MTPNHDPDSELREELEYHLARRADLDQTTHADARRRFGNPTLIQEDLRSMLIPIWLDGLRQDLAYAARTSRKNPGFTAASIIALALGIGSATAVFSVVDPLLFRPLPYQDADRLASIGMAAPIEPSEWLLGPDYYEWRDQQTVFTSMTANFGRRQCDLTEGDPVRLACEMVESTFLPTFGVRPALGRNFTSEEDQPNGVPVALISDALWQTRFGGSDGVVGKSIELEGHKTEIIGVLPKGFETPTLQKIDFLIPMRIDEKRQRARGAMVFLHVFGRLKPGITVDQARESLKPLFDHSMNFVPPHFRNEVKLRVSSFRERQTRDYRSASLVLLGAVLLVLLVACANVANLMLARGASREREMAVRAAIGASRKRLLRQTFTENLCLSLTAGLAGVALAFTLLAVFRNLSPEGLPRLATAAIDWRVLLSALVLSLLSGTLAGLAPALRLPQPESLTGTRATGPRRDWLRQTLAAAQIAISLVLLAGSGLLIRSLYRLQQIDLGIRTDQVLVTRLELGRDRPHDAQRAFVLELERRLRPLRGVEVVALSDALPPQERRMNMIYSRMEKEGVPIDTQDGTGGMVATRIVSPTYFQALAVPIVKGRPFTEEDRNLRDGLVIIDETLARRLYPGEDPIGKRIRPGGEGNDWLTVTGIARNARNAGLFNPSDPEYYVLMRNHSEWDRHSFSGLFVLVKTQRDIRAIAPLIRAEINRLDPKMPVEIEALDTRVRQLIARPRFNAMLLGLFATFALALAAIGLSGVVSYLVTQRTQELGVRMALGASPGNIRGLVLSQSLRWILAGAAVGFAAGLVATRALKAMLFQVEPNDPVILGSVTAVLVGVGVLAAWIPASRAARLDPMAALRHD